MTNPLNLTELQIALLYSASGDDLRLDKAVRVDNIDLRKVLPAMSGLISLNLITPDSTAVGAGYITTDAGNAYLAGLAKP